MVGNSYRWLALVGNGWHWLVIVGNAGSRADWENPSRWLSIATCSPAQSPQEGLQQVKMAKSIIYQDDIDLGFDLKINDFYQNLGMKPRPQKIPKLSCSIGVCGPFCNWVMSSCELFCEGEDWDATNLSEQAKKKTIYLNDQTLPVGTIWHLVNRILLLQRPRCCKTSRDFTVPGNAPELYQLLQKSCVPVVMTWHSLYHILNHVVPGVREGFKNPSPF